MIELDAYIDRVKVLPPAPQLLPELLTLLNQPNVDNERIVNLIRYDPALTASILQLSNSAAFAGTTPVVHLEEAVTRLGFQEVYRMVAATVGARTMRRQSGDAGQLWRHSVTTAVAAQLIAQDLGEDPNLIFTAALLHDIGKIILSDGMEETYSKLVQEVEANHYSLLEAEKRVLGVQHSEIGGRLLARWKFPLSLVTAVWFHHYPAAARPYERAAAHIYLGNLIAHLVGYGSGYQALAVQGRAEALSILKLDGSSLPRYMNATYEKFSSIHAFCNGSA